MRYTKSYLKFWKVKDFNPNHNIDYFSSACCISYVTFNSYHLLTIICKKTDK